MRKFLLIVVIAIFLISLVKSEKNEEIRVRIIPNSNSEEDIKIKNEVKDAVCYYLYNIYDESFNEYKNNIANSVGDLKKIIEDEFCDCYINFDYHTLYNKTYNGNKVKDEEVLVLVIKLGNGNGDNWWGSVYPNYLSVSSSEEYRYESLFISLINKIKGERNENRENR
jgi:hypothetical protein